jgi:hypothetical protein
MVEIVAAQMGKRLRRGGLRLRRDRR